MEQYTLINGYHSSEARYVYRNRLTKEILNVVLVVGGSAARDIDAVFNALLHEKGYTADMIEVTYEKVELLTKRAVTVEEYKEMCK